MKAIYAAMVGRLGNRQGARAGIRPEFPSRAREWHGFLAFLALVVVVDRFSTYVVYVSFAGLIYLIVLVYLACWAGLRAALAGCLVLDLYVWLVYHFPISAFGRLAGKANQALISTAIFYPIFAIIGGVVQNRFRRAAIREFDARAAADTQFKQRQIVEAELWASQEMRKLIVESSGDAVIGMADDGTITMWNPNAQKLFGWTQLEAIGSLVGDRILPPHTLGANDAGLRSFNETGAGPVLRRQIELIAQRKSGEQISVELYIADQKTATESVFIGFARDISGRKRAERAIREMNARLEERVSERTAQLEAANSELIGFTYSISHDLRAPLRAIVANSRIVREEAGASLDAISSDRLKRLESNALNMAELIENLLQFARIGQVALNWQEVDLSRLVQEIAHELKELKDGSVSVQKGMLIRADPEMIKLVMFNLMENAWKYTQADRSPKIEVGAISDTSFFVRDYGIGFDMQFVEKIWEPFERLHRGSEYPGTGIGLANCKRIIARHGGRIWADSAPGEGTTLYFQLGGQGDSAVVRDLRHGRATLE